MHFIGSAQDLISALNFFFNSTVTFTNGLSLKFAALCAKPPFVNRVSPITQDAGQLAPEHVPLDAPKNGDPVNPAAVFRRERKQPVTSIATLTGLRQYFSKSQSDSERVGWSGR